MFLIYTKTTLKITYIIKRGRRLKMELSCAVKRIDCESTKRDRYEVIDCYLDCDSQETARVELWIVRLIRQVGYLS